MKNKLDCRIKRCDNVLYLDQSPDQMTSWDF